MQRLKKGEELSGIPADTWNRLVDAAERVLRNESATFGKRTRGRSGPVVTVEVINDSDDVILKGRPIIYTEPVSKPQEANESATYTAPAVRGTAPNDEYSEVSSSDNWALTTDVIPSGFPGACATHGLAWAYVEVRDAADTTCGLNTDPQEYEDGSLLVSGVAGAKIVWKQAEDDEYVDETGEQWCLVLLGAGDSNSNDNAGTQYAMVTDEAPPSLWTGDESGSFKITAESRGKAVLLEQLNDGTALIDEWQMQQPEDEYQTLEDIKFWVVSIYDDVPLQVGKLIKVTRVPPPTSVSQSYSGFEGGFGGRVTPGTHVDQEDEYSDERSTALGEYVKPSDYFRAAATYDPNATQVLYHEPETEYDERGAPMIWDYDECEPES